MDVCIKKEMRETKVFESDGQKIFGILHRAMQENSPLVVIFHGFASHKLGTGRHYVTLAEALVEAGVSCLRFDLRGSGDSEGHLSEMTLQNMIDDSCIVVKRMEEEGFGKIGFFGSSLGGAISILTAARLGFIQSLAVWAPIASGELWVRDYLSRHPLPPSVSPEEALKTYRGIKLHPEFRLQFSRLFTYQEMEQFHDLPFLHFQGEEDDVLSITHQQMFKKHRQQASAPTHFQTFPKTGHWLGHAEVLPIVIEELVRWFKKTL